MTIIYDEEQKNKIYKWRKDNIEKYNEYCRNFAKKRYNTAMKNYKHKKYILKKECAKFLAILRE
jgi:hypothetical protein